MTRDEIEEEVARVRGQIRNLEKIEKAWLDILGLMANGAGAAESLEQAGAAMRARMKALPVGQKMQALKRWADGQGLSFSAAKYYVYQSQQRRRRRS